VVLIENLFCSFIDRDMFMRHFGHGVGHLQYERQHEPNHNTSMGLTLDDISDSSDDLDTGDSDADELDIHHNCNDRAAADSDEEEEEEEEEEEIVNDDGDASDIIVSDSDVDGSDSDGYASY
jgi:hypothetical protein